MSIKNPTAADLAHLRDGYIVEARFGGVTRCGQVRLHQDKALMLDGLTVRRPDGEPGVALDELISPLPPHSGVRAFPEVVNGDVSVPYVVLSPGEARDFAAKIVEAADEADRLPDGVYRVSFPSSPEGVVAYRRVVAGEPLNEHGVAYPEAIGAIILERVGDIPSAT